MAARVLIVILIVALILPAMGCRLVGHGGEDFLYRAWKHIELHIYQFYRQLVALHWEVDRYIFDMDWEDPDVYP